MKISIISIAVLLLTILGFSSCEKSSDLIEEDMEISLTEQEKEDLLFMREEEKLARDVYLYLYDKYDVNIFKNISSSEQTHMNYALAIMEEYGVEDPASADIGVFSNQELQALYDALILQGDISLEDAFIVGAIIEDVDIQDLQVAIDNSDKTDIIGMYEKLKCGSENHLRAFDSQLKDIGSTYTPQYISQEIFDEIITGDHSHCG